MTDPIAPTRSTLDRFFDPLIERRKVEATYRNQMKQMGLNFNPCDLIMYEAQLSDVFKDLLDPEGSHGQGSIFLGLFLSQLDSISQYHSAAVPEQRELPIVAALRSDLERSSRHISVVREQPTEKRRFVDLVVRGRTKGILGIENKPWAGHLNNQLADYACYLRGKDNDGCWALVYIAELPGQVPGTSIRSDVREKLKNSGNYIELSYAVEIAAWLKECYRICEGDKVRWFLRDLREFITKRFRAGEVEQ